MLGIDILWFWAILFIILYWYHHINFKKLFRDKWPLKGTWELGLYFRLLLCDLLLDDVGESAPHWWIVGKKHLQRFLVFLVNLLWTDGNIR